MAAPLYPAMAGIMCCLNLHILVGMLETRVFQILFDITAQGFLVPFK
jgi:hypothetical protein